MQQASFLTEAPVVAKGQRKPRPKRERGPDRADGYGVILADPPWSYDNDSLSTSAATAYSTMTIEAIRAMPIAQLAADDAVLLLWMVWPLLLDCLSIIEPWGFRYKTGFPWLKVTEEPTRTLWDTIEFRPQVGTGWWVRGCSELVAVCVRGDARPPADPPIGLLSPNAAHSRKPICLHDYAEQFPGPYLELFARRRERPGWDYFGNQVEGSIALPEARDAGD